MDKLSREELTNMFLYSNGFLSMKTSRINHNVFNHILSLMGDYIIKRGGAYAEFEYGAIKAIDPFSLPHALDGRSFDYGIVCPDTVYKVATRKRLIKKILLYRQIEEALIYE